MQHDSAWVAAHQHQRWYECSSPDKPTKHVHICIGPFPVLTHTQSRRELQDIAEYLRCKVPVENLLPQTPAPELYPLIHGRAIPSPTKFDATIYQPTSR